MQELIDEKLKEFKALGVVNLEFRRWLDKSDLWHWLYSQLRIMGEPVSKAAVVDILDGKIVEAASIEAYNIIQGYSKAYSDMKSCASMEQNPDMKMLKRWGELILGETPPFRKGDPIVYEWNHIPPSYEGIAAETDMLLRKASAERYRTPSLRWMARLHLELCKLYSYGTSTQIMAFAVLAYCLIREDYPLPMLTVGDSEYNKMIGEYVNAGESSGFESMLERSVLNRLESVLQLSRRAAEINDLET